MNEHLRRRERLAAGADYTRCYRHGRRLRTPYFVIYAYHHGEDVIRLGLAVSKAVGMAVVRNRVKRRLRELFRRRKVLVPRGYDLFVRGLPASAAASFETLEDAWCTAVGVLTATEDPGHVGLKNR